MVETPKVVPYSSIRGWINAARKATIQYGDCVANKFSIGMKCGAPPLADTVTLLRYIDSYTLNQKAGNFKQFLTKQLVEQHRRRGLQVCYHKLLLPLCPLTDTFVFGSVILNKFQTALLNVMHAG